MAVLALAALIASSGAWGQRVRLGGECRTAALHQCLPPGPDRGPCRATAMQSLPDGCRDEGGRPMWLVGR
jgi:hypothetical protein